MTVSTFVMFLQASGTGFKNYKIKISINYNLTIEISSVCLNSETRNWDKKQYLIEVIWSYLP